MKHHASRRSAFTIAEMAVVITVIAIIAGFTIFTYSKSQSQARKKAAQVELRETASALKSKALYSNSYPDTLGDLGAGENENYSYYYEKTATGYCLTVQSVIDTTIVYKTTEAGDIVAGQCTITTPISTAITPRGENPPNETAVKAFDSSSSTKWLDFSPTTWIIFSTTAPIAPSSYSITSANDAPDRDPKNWTLYGSNDRVFWTAINSQTGQTFASRFLTKNYSMTPPATAYSHFKYEVTLNNGSATIVQLAEIAISGATVVQ